MNEEEALYCVNYPRKGRKKNGRKYIIILHFIQKKRDRLHVIYTTMTTNFILGKNYAFLCFHTICLQFLDVRQHPLLCFFQSTNTFKVEENILPEIVS